MFNPGLPILRKAVEGDFVLPQAEGRPKFRDLGEERLLTKIW